MALFDKNTWYILQHLHQGIAAQAAACIERGESVQPQAYLVSAAPVQDSQARMQIAEVATDFIEALLQHEGGEQRLAQYLADALQEGSVAQRQIEREHGIQASYTVSVCETCLPHADNSYQRTRPALMVLLRGPHFTLPILHPIAVLPQQQRRCLLRAFPDLAEIEAAQHVLQTRLHRHSMLH